MEVTIVGSTGVKGGGGYDGGDGGGGERNEWHCVIIYDYTTPAAPVRRRVRAADVKYVAELMDPTEITMINDLGLSNDIYAIKGNKIECTVDKSYVILGQALEEYVDVYIHKLTLGLYVDGVMKFVDTQNKLFFQYNTRVTKCIGFNGPKNYFSFANFQDLIDKVIPSTISFDAIGNVFQCYPLEPATQKLDKRITLKLKDLEGRQVFATLWGDYAEQIDSYVSKHWGNFVMIIQCAKLKNRRGLFINTILNEKESGSASSCSRATASIMYTVHDNFLKNNPFYQISMIHELDEGSYAVILDTIKMFEDSQQWYYPACKNRKRKVQKMPLEQSNVLDHVAENESWMGNIVGFPVEINELIGRKMTLKIIVKRYTSGRKYIHNYNISKISDNVDIIFALEKLEKANDIEQDIETESVNVVVSDFNSQDTIGFKGSASFVADNTHISTFPNTISMSPSANHDTTSLLSPPTNAKRKLVDVYNLEDTVCESSTKPSKKSIGVKESVVSTQLLIPKVKK
uniref:DUF223 domain-containing protein n=1 Tax=Lactuca sativa TaxID=4236 RepID=A0A9R1WFG6_LACSA|nr:hypothetical protein LSAT_V11C100026180 [Lactuca sativa]